MVKFLVKWWTSSGDKKGEGVVDMKDGEGARFEDRARVSFSRDQATGDYIVECQDAPSERKRVKKSGDAVKFEDKVCPWEIFKKMNISVTLL